MSGNSAASADFNPPLLSRKGHAHDPIQCKLSASRTILLLIILLSFIATVDATCPIGSVTINNVCVSCSSINNTASTGATT